MLEFCLNPAAKGRYLGEYAVRIINILKSFSDRNQSSDQKWKSGRAPGFRLFQKDEYSTVIIAPITYVYTYTA